MVRALRAVAITAAFLLLFSIPASADTAALSSVAGGESAQSSSDQLYGWIFRVDTPIDVTALGVYDIAGDAGLSVSHDVGIYLQSDESLMGFQTVPSGTVGTLIDGFRYENVSPFALAPDTYVIVMTMPTFNVDYQLISSGAFSVSFSTASDITYVTSAFDDGSALHFPAPGANGSYAPGIFGPNFTFTSSTVPEPSTYSALGLGLAALLAFGRRRA